MKDSRRMEAALIPASLYIYTEYSSSCTVILHTQAQCGLCRSLYLLYYDEEIDLGVVRAPFFFFIIHHQIIRASSHHIINYILATFYFSSLLHYLLSICVLLTSLSWETAYHCTPPVLSICSGSPEYAQACGDGWKIRKSDLGTGWNKMN